MRLGPRASAPARGLSLRGGLPRIFAIGAMADGGAWQACGLRRMSHAPCCCVSPERRTHPRLPLYRYGTTAGGEAARVHSRRAAMSAADNAAWGWTAT